MLKSFAESAVLRDQSLRILHDEQHFYITHCCLIPYVKYIRTALQVEKFQ